MCGRISSLHICFISREDGAAEALGISGPSVTTHNSLRPNPDAVFASFIETKTVSDDHGISPTPNTLIKKPAESCCSFLFFLRA
jgi:hypothetical protein